jgi:hypothetical protein
MLATPTPTPSNPYNMPSTDYGQSAPPPPYSAPSQTPYTVPPQAPYGAQPVQQPQQPYGVPPQQPYGVAPGAYANPQFAPVQPQKKTNGCLIAFVIVLVIFVLVIGGIVATVAVVAKNAGTAINNSLTAVATYGTVTIPTVSGGSGLGATDPNAAAVITAAQSTSGVDSNQVATDSQTSFTTPVTMYIAVKLADNHSDGYARVKLYKNSTYDVESDILALPATYTTASFSFVINNPGLFSAGVYWCTKSDCSDAALGQVVTFTAS